MRAEIKQNVKRVSKNTGSTMKRYKKISVTSYIFSKLSFYFTLYLIELIYTICKVTLPVTTFSLKFVTVLLNVGSHLSKSDICEDSFHGGCMTTLTTHCRSATKMSDFKSVHMECLIHDLDTLKWTLTGTSVRGTGQ